MFMSLINSFVKNVKLYLIHVRHFNKTGLITQILNPGKGETPGFGTDLFLYWVFFKCIFLQD